MVNFIKSHKKLMFFLGAFVFFILFLIIVFLPKNPRNILPSQTISPAGFVGIKPGETTKSDVVNSLGKASTEVKIPGGTIDDFKSASVNRTHEITFDSKNIVQIAKQVITAQDKKSPIDIQNTYGQPQNVLYGPDFVNGVNLYVYPEKGAAMLANVRSNTLFEIWYFSPTTLENFIKNFGSGYSSDASSNKSSF
jgi:hypothetical protein